MIRPEIAAKMQQMRATAIDGQTPLIDEAAAEHALNTDRMWAKIDAARAEYRRELEQRRAA